MYSQSSGLTTRASSSSSRKRPARPQLLSKIGRKRTNIPRAIATRGIPGGYYEIPVVNQFKIYVNSTTGMFNTNQDTGVPSGATGYRGFNINTDLQDVRISLGEGSSAVTLSQPVPGFTQMASVFDLCKIAKLDIEVRILNGGNDGVTSTDQASYTITCAKDYNSNVPPGNKTILLQYSDQKTTYATQVGVSAPVRYSFTPYTVTEALTEGGSTAASINQPATYLNTAVATVVHRGLLGWLDLMSAGGGARTYYIYITVRQTRRYKMSI